MTPFIFVRAHLVKTDVVRKWQLKRNVFFRVTGWAWICFVGVFYGWNGMKITMKKHHLGVGRISKSKWEFFNALREGWWQKHDLQQSFIKSDHTSGPRLLPGSLTASLPLNIYPAQKRKVVFQPSLFRGKFLSIYLCPFASVTPAMGKGANGQKSSEHTT